MASIRKVKIQAHKQRLRDEAKAKAKEKKDAIDTANRLASKHRKEVKEFLGFDKFIIKSIKPYDHYR